jgi:hypothetical protein
VVPDPHFRGAGLHQILPGGHFKVHADFDMHPRLDLRHRLNVFLYLNEDWDASWGGSLELWDRQMARMVTAILPVSNRLVVFTTTDDSYHGHPDPLACPEGRTRRSMACYYYTATQDNRVGHSTLFRERPGEKLTTRWEDLRRKMYAAVPVAVKVKTKRFLGL